MSTVVILPHINYLDEDPIVIETFYTYEEALEWAQEFLGADENGKIQVVKEVENNNEGELDLDSSTF